MIDIRNMEVREAKCATCVFREDGDPRLRSKIELKVLSVSQTCHHVNDTQLCRGARDFQLQFAHRIGFLKEPTDECWAAKRQEMRDTTRRTTK